LCILGTWPSRRQAISREGYGDTLTFRYNDKNEEHDSLVRRDILRRSLQPPIGNVNNNIETLENIIKENNYTINNKENNKIWCCFL
jgi:hypothetical protein